MTLDQAIEMLRRIYNKAKDASFVRNPLAYALYQTWKAVDRKTRK